MINLSRPPKVSGIFDTLLGAGLSQGIPLIKGALAPKPPKQAKPCTLVSVTTQGETALCLDQIWSQWNSVLASGVQADIDNVAIGINQLLTDTTKWNAANTNPYLVNSRAFFADQASKASARNAQAVQTASVAPLGVNLGSPIITGVPNLYLLGGGLVVGWFLLKGNK